MGSCALWLLLDLANGSTNWDQKVEESGVGGVLIHPPERLQVGCLPLLKSSVPVTVPLLHCPPLFYLHARGW